MINGTRAILRLVAFGFIGCLVAAGCASGQKEYGTLERAGENDELYVSFDAAAANYRRTVSEINRTNIGWTEYGTWMASNDTGVAVVNIYLATLYDGRAFKKKGVQELRAVARDLSGLTNLDYGAEGTIDTNSGPVEYVFYRQSGRPCVFIRKYWSDPEMQSDLIQLTGTFGWIAGTSFIYASDCRAGDNDLQLQDLNRLFNGITATNLYWPKDMFTSVDGTLGGGSLTSSDGPGSDVDISGSYVSEITSNSADIFPDEYRTIVITLKQDGNSIVGEDSTGEFKVNGSRNGNTINFITGEMAYSKCKCNFIAGQWKISFDGSKLEGSWDRGAGFKGKWNLTKIE